jgi:uncharacterized protein (TIGR03643 family)
LIDNETMKQLNPLNPINPLNKPSPLDGFGDVNEPDEEAVRVAKPMTLKTVKLPIVPTTVDAFTEADKSRICEMAWEDRTPFEAIRMQFGLTEGQTIDLMRQYMKRSSFLMWRKRMTGLTVKHAGLRSPDVTRHKANNRSPSR